LRTTLKQDNEAATISLTDSGVELSAHCKPHVEAVQLSVEVSNHLKAMAETAECNILSSAVKDVQQQMASRKFGNPMPESKTEMPGSPTNRKNHRHHQNLAIRMVSKCSPSTMAQKKVAIKKYAEAAPGSYLPPPKQNLLATTKTAPLEESDGMAAAATTTETTAQKAEEGR
jgi:hypothetical protein